MSFFAQTISLGKRQISPNSEPYIIAELGINHNGNVETALKMVEAAAKSGAHCVKLQSYTTSRFIHPEIPEVKGLYEIFESCRFDEQAHRQVQDAAIGHGLDFTSTPLSLDAVEMLDALGVPFFKIASGDVNHFQLIECAAKTGKPLVISTGAAGEREIGRLIDFLNSRDFSNVIFLHCVSLYPTKMEEAHIGRISALRERTGALVGFSDHTEGDLAAAFAVIAGAVVIEKHFTLDKTMEGPDQKLSADPAEFSRMVKAIQVAYKARGSVNMEPNPKELQSDYFGKRSLYETKFGLEALRPREQGRPLDSDIFNQD